MLLINIKTYEKFQKRNVVNQLQMLINNIYMLINNIYVINQHIFEWKKWDYNVVNQHYMLIHNICMLINNIWCWLTTYSALVKRRVSESRHTPFRRSEILILCIWTTLAYENDAIRRGQGVNPILEFTQQRLKHEKPNEYLLRRNAMPISILFLSKNVN